MTIQIELTEGEKQRLCRMMFPDDVTPEQAQIVGRDLFTLGLVTRETQERLMREIIAHEMVAEWRGGAK